MVSATLKKYNTKTSAHTHTQSTVTGFNIITNSFIQQIFLSSYYLATGEKPVNRKKSLPSDILIAISVLYKVLHTHIFQLFS